MKISYDSAFGWCSRGNDDDDDDDGDGGDGGVVRGQGTMVSQVEQLI
jgi:hypothetical protein